MDRKYFQRWYPVSIEDVELMRAELSAYENARLVRSASGQVSSLTDGSGNGESGSGEPISSTTTWNEVVDWSKQDVVGDADSGSGTAGTAAHSQNSGSDFAQQNLDKYFGVLDGNASLLSSEFDAALGGYV